MVRRHRPSRTARDVAALCVMRARHPRYAGIAADGQPQELEALLRASGAQPGWQARCLSTRLAHGWMDLQERLFLPGISAHLLARKRFVEDEARAAIAAGARQLVVLGAGYDPLAARMLDANPGLVALEVDHPPTQARKRRAYGARAGAAPHLVPLDLARADLRGTLERAGVFEVGAPSVFVAEGLLMYLAEEQVLDLLRTCGDLAARGSRLVLSHCDADGRGRPRLGRHPRLARCLARLVGEPLRWGCRPQDLPAFAGRAGLVVRRQPDVEELTRELLPRRAHRLLVLGFEGFAVLEG